MSPRDRRRHWAGCAISRRQLAAALHFGALHIDPCRSTPPNGPGITYLRLRHAPDHWSCECHAIVPRG